MLWMAWLILSSSPKKDTSCAKGVLLCTYQRCMILRCIKRMYQRSVEEFSMGHFVVVTLVDDAAALLPVFIADIAFLASPCVPAAARSSQ